MAFELLEKKTAINMIVRATFVTICAIRQSEEDIAATAGKK